MRKPKKKATPKRKASPPRRIDTMELCKELVAMAGLLDNRYVAHKIYKAVRQLQLLDQVAKSAGILPE